MLAPILFVPGLLYEALVRARNGLYAAGALPRHRLPGPTISVGNLTMGGTGKTPLVLYIAQTLAKQGFQPAILTRGYKRARPYETLVLSPGEKLSSAAGVLGDEPAVMRRHIPNAWMGISKNRFLAGSRIFSRAQQSIFILDDGFQHRTLCRDLDIVILDCSQPLQSNRVFPRGTLREPLSALHRSNIVVLNSSQGNFAEASFFKTLARTAPNATVFRCSQTIESLVPFQVWSGMTLGFQPQQLRSAYLVGALGNPERFELDVRRLGIDVVGTKFLPDHYWPKPGDWQTCTREARSSNADAIIITEKDAVKISHAPDFPLMVSMQATVMSDASAFEMILKQCAKERKTNPAAGRNHPEGVG